MQNNKTIILYGTPTCADCFHSRLWLDEHKIPYKDINVAENEELTNYITNLNNGLRKTPTIVFPDGSFLVEPTNKDLEDHLKKLGLTPPTQP